MLLMCFRLQELNLVRCVKLTDRGLLEGIGSLQGLTSLCLWNVEGVTAEAFSKFLHQPSMTSIVSLTLYSGNLNDEVLKGIAERCNKLTYLHI
jgi:hypothetical protein